jgi:DNA-binding MarR family transcriptional regulator
MSTPEPHEELLDALVRSAFTVTAVLTSIGAEHDLSLTQVRVLGILRDRTLRMADLADHLGLERSTLSGLVDRAEARGLLERRRSAADRRTIEVGVTDAGRALTTDAYRAVAAALAPAVARLDADERRSLAALLGAFVGPDPDPEPNPDSRHG